MTKNKTLKTLLLGCACVAAHSPPKLDNNTVEQVGAAAAASVAETDSLSSQALIAEAAVDHELKQEKEKLIISIKRGEYIPTYEELQQYPTIRDAWENGGKDNVRRLVIQGYHIPSPRELQQYPEIEDAWKQVMEDTIISIKEGRFIPSPQALDWHPELKDVWDNGGKDNAIKNIRERRIIHTPKELDWHPELKAAYDQRQIELQQSSAAAAASAE